MNNQLSDTATLALAQQFMSEVLGSKETLAGIAENYGAETLADLLCLQDAILNGKLTDIRIKEAGGGRTYDFIETLPSRETWAKFMNPDGFYDEL